MSLLPGGMEKRKEKNCLAELVHSCSYRALVWTAETYSFNSQQQFGTRLRYSLCLVHEGSHVAYPKVWRIGSGGVLSCPVYLLTAARAW